MNNEIKEILDDLDYCIARKRGTITLNHKDCELLLDYITNLEEENQRLLKKSYSDDVRMTKASEYIKNSPFINDITKISLSNILDGGGEDNVKD